LLTKVPCLGGLLEAGVDVHADAVGEVAGSGGEHLVEGCARVFVLAGLHELERGLIEAEGLSAAWSGLAATVPARVRVRV